jgi:hypothetical protein
MAKSKSAGAAVQSATEGQAVVNVGDTVLYRMRTPDGIKSRPAIVGHVHAPKDGTPQRVDLSVLVSPVVDGCGLSPIHHKILVEKWDGNDQSVVNVWTGR